MRETLKGHIVAVLEGIKHLSVDDAADLIRAQAAEIERLRVERDTARKYRDAYAGMDRIATHALRKVNSDDPLPPCPSCGGSKIEDTARASPVVCVDCGWAAATRGEWRRVALIDTPAPPAEPAGEATKAMVDAAFKALPADADGTIGTGEMYRVIEAALAAAPSPIQPAPQCVACDDRPKPPNNPCAVCGQPALPLTEETTDADDD